MSTAPPLVEAWTTFWTALKGRLDEIDLTSPSSTKFDACRVWIAREWGFESDEVVCKYVQHPKNRWNRLREATRRDPSALLLLFEGPDHGDLQAHVEEAASQCSMLRLVVVLVRPLGGDWEPSAFLTRNGSALPSVFEGCGLKVTTSTFGDSSVPEQGPLPQIEDSETANFRSLLVTHAATGGGPSSPHRTEALESLASITGLPPDRLSFKAIPSTKNLGNRLGEALGRRPQVLVVVCPEVLQPRIVEELGRWDSGRHTPTILVLCGEETRIEVRGPPGELTSRLRSAIEPTEVAVLHQAPEMPAGSWDAWTYDRWNDLLVDYCFRTTEDDAGPVERLAATPEEIALASGATQADSETVASCFVEACKAKVPRGTSFCGFCHSYEWCTDMTDVPPFFGMLWLTSLIAYGYPTAEGGFYQRLWSLLDCQDHVTCLPDLWREIREWTLARRQIDLTWRELVLPPDDDFRTTIGHSHFLAFPHEYDRRRLARTLIDGDLVGFEPPITPVIAILQRERKNFSRYFQEDLNHFVENYVKGDRDPRASAFWRAVRQEALEPSALPGSRRGRKSMTSLLGVFDEEDFLLLLGCSSSWNPPPDIRIERLDNHIGGYDHYATSNCEGVEGILPRLFESMGFLGPGARALMNQGVLVFQEDQANEYYLVSGHDIAGADVALVRDDLVNAFVCTFGGSVESSRVKGWSEVTRCRVRPLDDLPEDLDGAIQLLRTMNPPTLRFVGGIQLPGGYLGFEGMLPRVRAPGARETWVVRAGERLGCKQVAESEWHLPARLTMDPLPVDVRVVAEWASSSGETRKSERELHLQPAVIADEFKPLAGGHYFVESCQPGQREVAAGSVVPLRIASPVSSASYDLIESEPSARYLGPGHGEMALNQSSAFDWLAIGPKKAPELLVFVGDVAHPQPPSAARSPHAGDRRHWKSAFAKAKRVVVRAADGSYLPVEDFPRVAAARDAYRRHICPTTALQVRETGLDTVSIAPPGRSTPSKQTIRLADALAALSTRKGGLRYRTVQRLLEELVEVDDYVFHHELIRALAESGAVDIVRHQSYGSTRIIARRPRFVVIRRGPGVEAVLMGLVTSARRAQVERLTSEMGLNLQELQPGCVWQPSILRLRASWEQVEHLSAAADLAPPEWLLWGADGDLPNVLRVDIDLQGLRKDTPPEGYSVDRTWDWERRQFVRGGVPTGPVRVEQRVHPNSCSIFVVLVGESILVWTYIRNWAMLAAFDAAGLAPFEIDLNGWVMARGRSPVHLPLPLGRVCAVVGEGVPGPMLDWRKGTVDGYCYPFGRRVTDLVSRILPGGWVSMENS